MKHALVIRPHPLTNDHTHADYRYTIMYSTARVQLEHLLYVYGTDSYPGRQLDEMMRRVEKEAEMEESTIAESVSTSMYAQSYVGSAIYPQHSSC